MRKAILVIIAALLALTLLGVDAQVNSVEAQGGPSSDFPIAVEVTGEIATINANQITLTDGTSARITPATKGVSTALKKGLIVTITAELEDNDLVAKTIIVGAPAEATEVTPAPTVVATAAAQDGNGNGKGKGQGKDKDKDKGKGSDNAKGSGNNGKGQGNDKAQGKDKDKAQDDQKLAACLKKAAHPVALRLSVAFSADLNDILMWRCKGKGFGEIARAYTLAKANPSLTVDQIFAMRDDGKSWSEIASGAGLDPKNLASGAVVKPAKGKKAGK